MEWFGLAGDLEDHLTVSINFFLSELVTIAFCAFSSLLQPAAG